MMIYFPDKKALCLSEVAAKLMHNVYTIRGAKVRDALSWSKYINETLDLYPDAEVAFASHHWPTWGNANVRQFVANQRDTYRFLHDRALNLANQGETMDGTRQRHVLPERPGRRCQLARLLRHAQPQPARGLQLLPGLLRRQPGHAEPAAAGRFGQALRRGDGRRGRGAGERQEGLRRTATTAGWPSWSTTSSSPTRPTPRRASCRPTRSSSWATSPKSAPGAMPT